LIRPPLPAERPWRPHERVLLALEIYAGYARVRWLLRRRHDARAAVEALRRKRVPAAGVDGPRAASRLGAAVVRALEPLPTDSRCLFRALTLTWMLERRGIDSRLVIAARTQPFEAHAWVECATVPVLPPGGPGYERLAEM
jgi:hypothetical protein